MKFFFILLAMVTLMTSPASASGTFTLSTPDFKDGDTIPAEYAYNGFGCKGQDKAPQLTWENAPADTKYFALTVYDPDAPTGSGWWHWVVINIPATAHNLDQNNLPEGALQTRTDYGSAGYGGPCPPIGDKPHRYYFTLYALKDKIEASEDTPAAQIGFQINSLKIGEAQILGYYSR